MIDPLPDGRAILVNVTQRHIDEGIQNSCAHCPLALAIYDSLRPAPNEGSPITVGVYDTEVRFRCFGVPDIGYGEGFTLYPSPEAMNFIKEFDKGKDVVPNSFLFVIKHGLFPPHHYPKK